jgi:hypothetical protein
MGPEIRRAEMTRRIEVGKLDGRYNVYVLTGEDPYRGELVVQDGDGDVLLREETTVSYGARFGPDVADVDRWTGRAIEAVDGTLPDPEAP